MSAGSSSSRLPDFLIIGGMKCGSTTLFRDLDTSPAVSFPAHKEPHNLLHEAVLTESGQAEYADLYRNAHPDQLLGDASTGYTKLPTHSGVPKRAKAILSDDLKLIYILRSPVARIESHYRHLQSRPDAKPAPLEDVLADFPEVIDYTCYGQQLQAWRSVFSEENFLILSLEHHEQHRVSSTNLTCDHLGIPHCGHLVESDAKWNSSTSKPVARGPLAPIITSPFYRRRIRPLMGRGLRDYARRLLLPKAAPASAVWTATAWDKCEERLKADATLLAELTDGKFGADSSWLKPPFPPSR